MSYADFWRDEAARLQLQVEQWRAECLFVQRQNMELRQRVAALEADRDRHRVDL